MHTAWIEKRFAPKPKAVKKAAKGKTPGKNVSLLHNEHPAHQLLRETLDETKTMIAEEGQILASRMIGKKAILGII